MVILCLTSFRFKDLKLPYQLKSIVTGQLEVVNLRFMKFFANMFESWFRRRFDTKCKLNIDLTLMRIEIIKRRRNAMQKFLRSDIAELLRIGHDSDAYGRVGRLYLDQNRTICYDFVTQYCKLISDQLTTMNDQSECPEECKEAVSSLIYAAARFGDLPELRKLRSLFHKKYENSFESSVNKEFVDMLKPDCPTKEIKVRLMQEIAQEHGVEWDPESLDNRLYKPNSSRHDRSSSVDDHQDKEPRIANHENGWMINIQETINDDSNAHKRDESNDDIVKQTENVRQRILDYWSRTTSLLSTSQETSNSPDKSSTSSDDSTKSRPFFNFRFMPDKTGTKSNTGFDSPTKNDDKQNEDVSNHPKVEKWDDEKVVATPRTVKNRWWRKGGGLTRVRPHSAERSPNPTEVEEQNKIVLGDSYGNPPTGHVHPKLPDYDEIKARFAAIRSKS